MAGHTVMSTVARQDRSAALIQVLRVGTKTAADDVHCLRTSAMSTGTAWKTGCVLAWPSNDPCTMGVLMTGNASPRTVNQEASIQAYRLTPRRLIYACCTVKTHVRSHLLPY